MTINTFAVIAIATVLFTIFGLRGRRRMLAQSSFRPTRFSITFDSAGFSITGLPPYSTERIQMAWGEVYRVVAYKHDLFCDFVICLFVARSDESGIELDEEMAGWEPFCEALPQFLPGYTPMPRLLGEIATFPATNVLYIHAVTPAPNNALQRTEAGGGLFSDLDA